MSREKRHKAMVIILGLIVSLTWIYPFVIIFFGSFKNRSEIFTNTLWAPQEVVTTNYPTAYESLQFTTSFLNSLLITTGSIVVIVIFSSMAAYALARRKSKISNTWI